MNKKAMAGVIATSLLIVVTVGSVVTFQSWFASFSSGLENKAGAQDGVATLDINQVRLDNSTISLYVKNKGNEYFRIKSLEINGNICGLPNSDVIESDSLTIIDTNCTSTGRESIEIFMLTSKDIINKEFYVK